MSTKGKGKDKNKKGKDQNKNKLTQVDKTFYELTIADLNKKLSRLRNQLMTSDEQNAGMAEQLRSIKEDRTDIAAHLERILIQRNETIAVLESQLNNIVNLRNTEKEESTAHIKDMDAKYRAMHDQLTSEIKLLTGKLNSLDEFRIKRELLLSKYESLSELMDEKDRQHQESVYALEQKAIVEKDALKKEVELKLLQVTEDFTRSSEIRNAGYTRRLIRENIALQKENDRLLMSQLKMQRDLNIQNEKQKEILEQNASLDQMKNQLIMSSQNKITIIKKLTDNYERLKAKYIETVRYRTLYESIMRRDSCERFDINKVAQKMKRITRKSNLLLVDKNRLLAICKKLESENNRLRLILQQIKEAIVTATIEKYDSHSKDKTLPKKDEKADQPDIERSKEIDQVTYYLDSEDRSNLLSKLLQTINESGLKNEEGISQMSIADSNVAIYNRGKIGLLNERKSIMDVFRSDAPFDPETRSEPTRYKLQRGPTTYIPVERAAAFERIIDVEVGSTYYASSSQKEAEEAVEENIEEAEEEESSDDLGDEEHAGSQTGVNVQAVPTNETVLPRAEATSSRNYDTSPFEGEDEYNINLFY